MTPKRIAIGIVSSALALLAIFTLSCNSSKKTTSVSKVDSSYVSELESTIKELERENSQIKKHIKELESGIACNDTLLQTIIEAIQSDLYISEMKKDSLVRALNRLSSAPRNEVIVSSSGEVQVRGAIRALNLKLREQTDSLVFFKERYREADSLLTVAASKKTETQVVTAKETKMSLFGRLWWLLILAGAVGGVIIYRKLAVLSIFKNNQKSNNNGNNE
jgi:cell division protein FtsB